MKHFPYTLSKEVEKAKTAGKAIVALETTIISHGMPYPQNFKTALEVESIIKNNGNCLIFDFAKVLQTTLK